MKKRARTALAVIGAMVLLCAQAPQKDWKPDFAKADDRWTLIEKTDCWVHMPQPAAFVVHWDGACAAGKISGKGIVSISVIRVPTDENFTYQGSFEDGRMMGPGVVTLGFGAILKGNFIDAVLNGKGTQEDGDGLFYQGNFVNGQPEGKGHFDYPDGSSYDGEVKGGVPEGQGALSFDGTTIAGQFDDQKVIGPVTLTRPGQKPEIGNLTLPRQDPQARLLPPPYDGIFLRLREEFQETAYFRIAADGSVQNMHRYTPYKGNALFDRQDAAFEMALAATRFLPAAFDGSPIDMPYRLLLNYRIAPDPK